MVWQYLFYTILLVMIIAGVITGYQMDRGAGIVIGFWSGAFLIGYAIGFTIGTFR